MRFSRFAQITAVRDTVGTRRLPVSQVLGRSIHRRRFNNEPLRSVERTARRVLVVRDAERLWVGFAGLMIGL